MRKCFVPVLIGVVVCSLCGVAVAEKGPGAVESAAWDVSEVSVVRSERPWKAP
ncbi:MAG: hypothetical protein K6T75_04725 [Acetobacteraceae bacterium]|nr:hypothetical protein [Acetobacteraceae bacterium]